MKFWMIFILLIILIIFPLVIVLISAFGSGNSLVFPPVHFGLDYFIGLFTEEEWINSIQTSLFLAITSILFALPLGTAIVFYQNYIEHKNKFLKNVVIMITSFPIAIPPILLGIGFFILTRSVGIQGNWFVLGILNSIIGIPIVYFLVNISLRRFPYSLTEAAATCGVKPGTILKDIVFPYILPSLLSSSIIIFMLSMEELVMALYVSKPTTIPVSVRFWTSIKYNITPYVTSAAVIMILIPIIFSLLFLLLRGRFRES